MFIFSSDHVPVTVQGNYVVTWTRMIIFLCPELRGAANASKVHDHSPFSEQKIFA